MRSIHQCVLIHIRTNDDVGTVKYTFKPLSVLFVADLRMCFLCELFCYTYLCFMFVSVMLSCLFHAALRSSNGQGFTPLFSFVVRFKMVELLLIYCLLLIYLFCCFVMQYLVSFLVFQSFC